MSVHFKTVDWLASEHPPWSRGIVAAGANWQSFNHTPGEDRLEKCCISTRNPRFLRFSLPRSKVFHPELPVPWGILWWRGVNEETLAELHAACMKVCSEVGLSEFCVMCHAGVPPARRYWREMLGENHEFLRWRS